MKKKLKILSVLIITGAIAFTPLLAEHTPDHKDPTATDQGKSEADVNTTKQIRKEIMSLKNISVKAQNVKVITRDGRVVLRGPVKTMDEKKQIEDIAQRVAGGMNVDNQLEVKN